MEKTMKQGCSSNNPARINRSLTERNRRIAMNDLLSKLFALIPTTPNPKLSVPELLEQTAIYAKQLQEKIEKMKKRREVLKGFRNFAPVFIIKYSDSTLEVTIICGFKKRILLHQVIRVIEEEGGDVFSTTYHHARDRIFYTIISKPIISRIGIETSRVHERLKNLVSEV